MSAVETKEPVKVSFKRNYEGFDENLNDVKNEVTVEYTEVNTLESAMAELNRINDYITAANLMIRKDALKTAKAKAGLTSGISRAVVMEFIKPFRESPDYSKLITSEDKRKATSEEWNAQTRAILNEIKNIPFIMAQIKKLSAEADKTEE